MPDKEYSEEEFKKEFNGQTILRILKQTRPHIHLLIGFLGFILISSLMAATGTFVMKNIMDKGIMNSDIEMIYHYIKIYILVMLADASGIYGFIYCASLLGENIKYDMRKKLFAHLQKLSFSYFDRTPAGWILSRMTSDVSRIAELATWMFLDIVWGISNIVASLIFMMFINWKLGLMAMVIVPVLVIIAIKFKKHIIREYRTVRAINSKITSAYSENIAGVKIVKALVREEKNLEEFGEVTDKMFSASYKAAWLSAMFLPVVELISALAICAVLLYGGWQTQTGFMTIGGIKAFISYITFMLWPIQDLSRVYAQMQQSIASAERVFSLMDTEPEIKDFPAAEIEAKFTGSIEFSDVDFSYKEGSPILSHFNLKIDSGETIAIVGPTGGGKTTLANLVSRFYEPTRGTIYFDEKDYRTYTQQALQSRIGVVLQHPHLFSGTVKENLLYGNPEATERELIDAVEKAHATKMIENLPGKMEEEVGEEGTMLSMGQKQLLNIARTILADPDIIIMDEATSSVDTLTEQYIQEGMKELLFNRTSIVIAHRLSTIKTADRILVVEKGKIIEEGTHKGLLAEKGFYYNLYTNQFRSEKTSAIGALK